MSRVRGCSTMGVRNLSWQALLKRQCPIWRLTFSLPTILRLAVFVVLVVSCTSTPSYGDFYVPVTLDEGALKAGTVRRETITGITQQRCVSLAVIRQWPILVCHSLHAAQLCTLYDWEALKTASPTKDRTLKGANCKMTNGFLACNSSVRGLVRADIPMDEFKCPSSSYKFMCSEKNGIEMVKVVPRTPLSGCSAPFVSTPVGCLYINDSPMTFSDARMTCFDYGTELVSPDSLLDLRALQAYLISNTPRTSHYWSGLMRQNWAGDDWKWLGNGRRPGPNLVTELASRSNGSGEWYTRMSPSSYDLDDATCKDIFGFVCEAKGL